jgi:hypothetical protein
VHALLNDEGYLRVERLLALVGELIVEPKDCTLALAPRRRVRSPFSFLVPRALAVKLPPAAVPAALGKIVTDRRTDLRRGAAPMASTASRRCGDRAGMTRLRSGVGAAIGRRSRDGVATS